MVGKSPHYKCNGTVPDFAKSDSSLDSLCLLRHSVLLPLNNLLDTGPRLTFSLGINHDFHLAIKSRMTLLRLPRLRRILAKRDFDFFNSLSASLHESVSPNSAMGRTILLTSG